MSEYRICAADSGVTCMQREMSWSDVTQKDIEKIATTIAEFYNLNGNLDEAVQAGVQGAVKAAVYYKPSKGPFKEYIKPFVIEAVINSLFKTKSA